MREAEGDVRIQSKKRFPKDRSREKLEDAVWLVLNME